MNPLRIVMAAAAAFSLAVLGACNPSGDQGNATGNAAPQVSTILTTADAVDIHSYAKPLEARVTHLALDLTVDFDAKRIGGLAALDIDRKPDAKEIILDDKGLEIQAITDAAGQPLEYKVGASDEILGAPLAIALRPDTRRIMIRYKSAPDAGSLQWLTPEQTAGKKHPYLFSQGQPIENRSWIPTQDSPGIRQSWEATIRVPAPLTAVMSSQRVGEPTTQGNMRVFKYRMANPVAPYLIAIAVGDLAFQELGPRSGVWTEPSMLPAAAKELEDTEKMIDAAEELFGPYRWGRYDMLVLPPSFPFGGMENPNLTFLTPTFIAGDKSLVSLIAHELAHSWSGNLATNATWADFWLNEGMTTYATYRIIEAIYGPKVAAQQYALGVDSLNEQIETLGGASGADTRLRIDLKGRHPDEGLTEIAYEKGAAFLRSIETAVGRERFDAWLKGWFTRHAFQPVTSAIFLADIREHLIKGDERLEQKLMLDQWVNQPGLPATMVKPNPNAFAEVDRAVQQFTGGGAIPAQPWARWTTAERLRFVNRLPRKIDGQRLRALDQQLRLSETRNNEVLYAWLSLAVANRYDPAVPALERFLTTQGRRKFVAPLIEALAKDQQWGRPIAARVYRRARAGYHPITTRGLDKLGL
ncbi:MAG: M1 family metallopeptidase [Pseudomonadota bacterium]|nr:M1 family metallopeptidase [Sphingomonas sp.]MDQ3479225.1 M1 family metallopeptidase [Pseudomonadota bacterium]